MFGRSRDDSVELECPECGAVFETTVRVAEKGKVRCPKGHEFPVVGMLGGGGGSETGDPV